MRASEIREILKVTSRPEVISFAGGLPAPELFPTTTLARIAERVIREEGARALQYSTTEGEPSLRRVIAERSNLRWGTQLVPEEVLVTTGSQQGLDLVGKLFLDEGDAVRFTAVGGNRVTASGEGAEILVWEMHASVR